MSIQMQSKLNLFPGILTHGRNASRALHAEIALNGDRASALKVRVQQVNIVGGRSLAGRRENFRCHGEGTRCRLNAR